MKISLKRRSLTIRKRVGILLAGIVLVLAGIVFRLWLIYPERLNEAKNPRIIFPNVTVNGQPVRLMLDTGESFIVLDQSKAESLGLKVTPPPPGVISIPGAAAIGLSKTAIPLVAGPQVFSVIMPVSMAPVGYVGFGRTDGAIGLTGIQNDILIFDSTKHIVSGAEKLPPETTGWLKLKVHKSQVLVLETPLQNGNIGAVMVDTGAPFGVALPPAEFKKWRAAHPAAPSDTMSFDVDGANSTTVTDQAWADLIKVGALTLTDVPVHEATPGEILPATTVGLDYTGTLGLYALERLTLMVDVKNGFAYLHPKPPPGPPYPGIDRPGIATDVIFGHSGNWDWTVAENVKLNFDYLSPILGQIKLAAKDYDGAIADYTLTIEQLASHTSPLASDPHLVEAYSNRGFAEYDKGDMESAIADFTHALDLDSKNVNAYFERAVSNAKIGNFDKAIADFDKALVIDPKNVDALIDRGIVKKQTGDNDGAIADYSQALNLDGKNAVVFFDRGMARISKGDNDGAITDFNQAIELDPKNATAYFGRGAVRQMKRDLDAAIADYNRVIELDPKNVASYFNRASAKWSQHDYDGAVADYDRVLELDPQNTMAKSYRDRAKNHEDP